MSSDLTVEQYGDLTTRLDALEDNMAGALHLVRHQFTIFGCRGQLAGDCRCGWSTVGDDVDELCALHNVHVAGSERPVLF